jgi:hypothetical protein
MFFKEGSATFRHIKQFLSRNSIIMHQGTVLGDHVSSQYRAVTECKYNRHTGQALYILVSLQDGVAPQSYFGSPRNVITKL